MINEYAMRDKIAAMTNSERAALPRIKNQNAPDYASCPRCRHYHAMMPAQAAIPADGYFNFNYCRDCGALAVVVKADADIIDFESPVTLPAPEATEAAADDEVTDFERAATVAAPQKQRVVVSIYGGCVSGVYADGKEIEVLIVDGDNIARSLGDDREAVGATRASIDRITQMGAYVRNAVAIFDDEPATCAACGDEFDVADNADFPNLGYEFCSTVCHDRHWRL